MKQESAAFLWCALALTDLRLKLLPHRCNRKLLAADTSALLKENKDSDTALGDNERNDEIMQLAQQVRSVARHGFVFNMSCLRQALVLRSRLRARGIPARLVYGARKNNEKFFAHAWVEVGSFRLDGGPETLFHKFED